MKSNHVLFFGNFSDLFDNFYVLSTIIKNVVYRVCLSSNEDTRQRLYFSSIVTTLFCSNSSIDNIFPESYALAVSSTGPLNTAATLEAIRHASKVAFCLIAGSLHLGSCSVKSNEPTNKSIERLCN
jgi:hypothetical protein